MTEILLESPPAVLSTTEQAARDRCETVIARGMAQFLAVGEALSEMRDSKLYRSTHATFADYCRERWDLGRARAYQLMDAAEVAGSLSTNVDIPPTTEAQLRALKSVPVDARAGVWQDAQATSGAAQPSAASKTAMERS